MQKNLHNLRKNYKKHAIFDDQIDSNPYNLFDLWFNDAHDHPLIDEVNAMTLSTLGVDGYPKSRVVLLKEILNGSFIFYTNYNSHKAQSITQNPKVCIHFFWASLERQVIIKGAATKVSREQSYNYFKTRPRGSQLGAWASDQSAPVESRQTIDAQLLYYDRKFENQQVPMPDHWGGYAIAPVSFEFWQGRSNRLHDRFIYTQQFNQWTINRLAP